LFPEDEYWRLETSGRRIFDAKLSISRRQGEVKDFLFDLAQAAKSSGTDASAVWVVQQDQIVEVKRDAKSSKNGKKDKKQQAPQQQNVGGGFIAIAVPIPPQSAPQQQVDVYLQNVDKVRLAFKKSQRLQHAGSFGALGIYVVQSPTNKEVNAMKDLHDSLTSSLSILIPSLGNAKITASNCMPTRQSLERVFFADEVRKRGDGDTWEQLEEQHISEQVVRVRQEIVFTCPFETALSRSNNPSSKPSNPPSASSGTGSKKGATKLQFGASSSSSTPAPTSSFSPYFSLPQSAYQHLAHPLIIDAPVGMRLLSSYKQGYKDQSMRLWQNPEAHYKYTGGAGDGRGSSSSGDAGGGAAAAAKIRMGVFPSTASSDLLSAAAASASSSTSYVPPPQRRLVAGSKEWAEAREKEKKKTNALAAAAAASSRGGGGGGEAESDEAVHGRQALPSRQQQQQQQQQQLDDEEKLILTCKTIGQGTGWTMMPSLTNRTSVARGNPKALLPRQSIQAVATHCGKGVLYGVAHNTMIVGQQGQMVRCEGVTFLPPGSRWLSLALQCSGINSSQIEPYGVDGGTGGGDRDRGRGGGGGGNGDGGGGIAMVPSIFDGVCDKGLSQQEEDLCLAVCQVMEETQMGDVRRSEELVALIEPLFAPWTDKDFFASRLQQQQLQDAARRRQVGGAGGGGGGGGGQRGTGGQDDEWDEDDDYEYHAKRGFPGAQSSTTIISHQLAHTNPHAQQHYSVKDPRRLTPQRQEHLQQYQQHQQQQQLRNSQQHQQEQSTRLRGSAAARGGGGGEFFQGVNSDDDDDIDQTWRDDRRGPDSDHDEDDIDVGVRVSSKAGGKKKSNNSTAPTAAKATATTKATIAAAGGGGGGGGGGAVEVRAKRGPGEHDKQVFTCLEATCRKTFEKFDRCFAHMIDSKHAQSVIKLQAYDKSALSPEFLKEQAHVRKLCQHSVNDPAPPPIRPSGGSGGGKGPRAKTAKCLLCPLYFVDIEARDQHLMQKHDKKEVRADDDSRRKKLT